MSSGQNLTETDIKRAINAYSMSVASIGAQVGCMTVVVIFIALFLGLWLDKTFQTKPTFTVGLMLGSIPVTLFAMFSIVKSNTNRIIANQKSDKPKNLESIPTEEESNSGTNA